MNHFSLGYMRNFLSELANKQLRWLWIWLLVIICTAACAQDRDNDDEDDDTVKTETNDKDAEKRAKKAERKTRKEKKAGKSSSGAVKLPPPPETPLEFEFFDGAIFSRKVNLGLKNVLCFASERRPLAMLWNEVGQADAGRAEGAATGSLPVKLTARELQLIFGRQVETTQISVLNENGEMTARGVVAQVAFNLGRQPVYLLVEVTPSRPKTPATSDKK